MERENYRLLKEFALASGMALFGVADMAHYKGEVHQLPLDLIAKLRYGVSLGVRLSDQVLEGIEDAPTFLYFWHYRQANTLLDRVAFQLANLIQDRGHDAFPIPASQIVDWKRQLGHLSHRHVGMLAGHGWIGKNNLLINPNFGARVRYVTILTNIPLLVNHSLDYGCGLCEACVGVCPAGALGASAEEYNFERCFEQLSRFRREYGFGDYICGICVRACRGLKEERRL